MFALTGGRAKTLQKAGVNVIEQETCQSWFASQGKKTKIQDGQICAGHEKGGIDACWVRLLNTNICKLELYRTFRINWFEAKIHNFYEYSKSCLNKAENFKYYTGPVVKPVH